MDDTDAVDGDIGLKTLEILSLKCWTHSDEAFLVTVIANNIDVWVCHLQKRPRSSAKPRFTKVVATMEGNQTKTMKEWSTDGITYYNKRIDYIEKEYEEKTSFYVEFLKSLRLHHSKQRKRKRVRDEEPMVDPNIFESILDKL